MKTLKIQIDYDSQPHEGLENLAFSLKKDGIIQDVRENHGDGSVEYEIDVPDQTDRMTKIMNIIRPYIGRGLDPIDTKDAIEELTENLRKI